MPGTESDLKTWSFFTQTNNASSLQPSGRVQIWITSHQSARSPRHIFLFPCCCYTPLFCFHFHITLPNFTVSRFSCSWGRAAVSLSEYPSVTLHGAIHQCPVPALWGPGPAAASTIWMIVSVQAAKKSNLPLQIRDISAFLESLWSMLSALYQHCGVAACYGGGSQALGVTPQHSPS